MLNLYTKCCCFRNWIQLSILYKSLTIPTTIWLFTMSHVYHTNLSPITIKLHETNIQNIHSVYEPLDHILLEKILPLSVRARVCFNPPIFTQRPSMAVRFRPQWLNPLVNHPRSTPEWCQRWKKSRRKNVKMSYPVTQCMVPSLKLT